MEKRNKMKIGAGAIIGIVLLVLGTYTALGHPPTEETYIRVFQGSVIVSLSATDDNSGVKYTSIAVYYRANVLQPWTTLLAPTNYTGNLTYSTQGRYQVHYFSEDNLGNVEAEKVQEFQIWQDTLAPTTTLTLKGNEIVPT
jgi:hypothetical protein